MGVDSVDRIHRIFRKYDGLIKTLLERGKPDTAVNEDGKYVGILNKELEFAVEYDNKHGGLLKSMSEDEATKYRLNRLRHVIKRLEEEFRE